MFAVQGECGALPRHHHGFQRQALELVQGNQDAVGVVAAIGDGAIGYVRNRIELPY